MRSRGVLAGGLWVASLALAAPAPAQVGGPANWNYGTQGSAPQAWPQPVASRRLPSRSIPEIGTLYLTSAAYGVGMGVWLSVELGSEGDPGVFLIPPVVLGIAAPTAVYFRDRPAMTRGLPAATSAGLVLGAGEGVAVAGLQHFYASEDRRWGFKGLARSTGIGATVGGAAGYAVGWFLEPPPQTILAATSGAGWGAAVGSMFAYGGSRKGTAKAPALGGVIGYNAGLAGMSAFGMALIPSWYELGAMWGGAGIGAAASLPIFLFYIGEDNPPLRRGFVFMGTTTTLGIFGGALFSGALDKVAGRDTQQPNSDAQWATITGIAPTIFTPSDTTTAFGLSVSGMLR